LAALVASAPASVSGWTGRPHLHVVDPGPPCHRPRFVPRGTTRRARRRLGARLGVDLGLPCPHLTREVQGDPAISGSSCSGVEEARDLCTGAEHRAGRPQPQPGRPTAGVPPDGSVSPFAYRLPTGSALAGASVRLLCHLTDGFAADCLVGRTLGEGQVGSLSPAIGVDPPGSRSQPVAPGLSIPACRSRSTAVRSKSHLCASLTRAVTCPGGPSRDDTRLVAR